MATDFSAERSFQPAASHTQGRSVATWRMRNGRGAAAIVASLAMRSAPCADVASLAASDPFRLIHVKDVKVAPLSAAMRNIGATPAGRTG
jgi:hypothetical protein